MKKLLLLVATIIFALLMIGAGYTAAFSDTESQEAEFIAGSLDLGLDGREERSTSIDVSNLAPGETEYHLVALTNTGTLPGRISFSFGEVINYENGQNTPEQQVDSTGGDPGLGNGELGAFLQAHLILAHPGISDPVCRSQQVLADDLQDTTWEPETAASSVCSQLSLLQPGETVHFKIAVKLAENAGNQVQSDWVEIKFNIHLAQD